MEEKRNNIMIYLKSLFIRKEINKMNNNSTIKVLISIFVLFIGIGIVTFFFLAKEPYPEHPLDYQIIESIKLDTSISTVDDGMPYAFKEALEWRKDAILTGLQIFSTGIQEIINNNGKFRYIFEFPYINETKPSGIMFISINTNTDCIEFISVSHDGQNYNRKIKELTIKNLREAVNKVYDVSVDLIGEKNIINISQPFVSVNIDNEVSTFKLKSKDKSYNINYSLKIDMNVTWFI
ncbi:MAG: hypothetical protein K0S61_4910 [Anaerocolumna sp.]|nr:hypothetical protein [Anaerocolumna sp.]